jgi:hypothetical protein
VKETRKEVGENGRGKIKVTRPDEPPKKWTAHYSDEPREEKVKQDSPWIGLVALAMVLATILGIVWIVWS